MRRDAHSRSARVGRDSERAACRSAGGAGSNVQRLAEPRARPRSQKRTLRTTHFRFTATGDAARGASCSVDSARGEQGAGHRSEPFALAWRRSIPTHTTRCGLGARSPGDTWSQRRRRPPRVGLARTRALLSELARSEPDESESQAIRAIEHWARPWASLERSRVRLLTGAACDRSPTPCSVAKRAEPLCAAVRRCAEHARVEVAQRSAPRAAGPALRLARGDRRAPDPRRARRAQTGSARPRRERRAHRQSGQEQAVWPRSHRAAARARPAPCRGARPPRARLAGAGLARPSGRQASVAAARERSRRPRGPSRCGAATRRDPKALPRLRELAKSKDVSVRATASAALARAYDFALTSRAQGASVHALLDPDARVRTATAVALLQSIGRLQAGI